MRGDWNEPVEIELGQIGFYRVIANTEQAAETLLNRWPVDKGRAYNRAKRICLDVLMDNEDPLEARKAFLAAADEIGLSTRKSQRYAVKGQGKHYSFGRRRA